MNRISKIDVLAALALVLVVAALTVMVIIGLELLEPCSGSDAYPCTTADPCCR